MRKTHVRRGRGARDRRYEAAVRRQIALIDGAFRRHDHRRFLYAPVEDFLRRGDDLAMFAEDGR